MLRNSMLRSYIRRLVKGKYIYDNKKGFEFSVPVSSVSEEVLQTARLIRGANRHPSIILHGVMPRSGSVYVGELLNLHPEIYTYPHEIWEFPFLRLAGDIFKLTENFLVGYTKNRGKIKEYDLLLLFSSAMIAYLYSFVPAQKRMFLREPGVEYLNYYFTAFPFENLIILMRDGRDVVTSTIKTWPMSFSDVCLWWNNSANMILNFNEQYSVTQSYCFVKYEDIIKNPIPFIKEVCDKFGLDEKQYPFTKIDTIPVYGSSVLNKGEKMDGTPVEKPANFNSVGRWTEWSRYQKSTFKRIAGQTLLALDYCTDLDW